MSEINFCSKCGAQVTDPEANFCMKCGYKFERIKEAAAPAVESLPQEEPAPQIEPAPQVETVKNHFYLKYVLSTGISGILISAFSAILTFVVLCFLISCSENEYNEFFPYDFGDLKSNYLPNNILLLIPVLFSLFSFKQLRNFANTQVVPEFRAAIRKISLCILIVIIGGVGNIIGSQIPFKDGALILLNLVALAGCIFGLIFTSINIGKAQKLYAQDSNIYGFMRMARIITFISAILLALSLQLELMYKINVLDGILYHDMIGYPILSSMLYIAFFVLLFIMSIRFIVTLRNNIPMVTKEQYEEIKRKL